MNFKHVTPLLMLLLLSSCYLQKDGSPSEEELPEPRTSIISRGLFVMNNTMYFSNGKDIYCGFRDKSHFDELAAKYNFNKESIFPVEEEPEKMKFVFQCSAEFIEVDKSDKKVLYRR